MKRIICISNINWDFLWQRHQIFMSKLSNEYEIIFIENTGIRKLSIEDLGRISNKIKSITNKGDFTVKNHKDNAIKIISPKVLPTAYSFFKIINERIFFPQIIKQLNAFGVTKNDIFWIYLPNHLAFYILEYYKPQNVIYDCNVNFESIPHIDLKFHQYERYIVSHSKLIFTDSLFLKNKIQAKYNKDAIAIPPGVDTNLFNPYNIRKKEQLFDFKGKKNIVFFGGIAKIHTDYYLLNKIADQFSSCNLILIGTIKDEDKHLLSKENVHYLGRKKYEQIPIYLYHSDVIILPYLRNEFTKGVIPAKLFECIAMNKPIVSMDIPELIPYKEYILLSKNHEEFIKNISNGLDMPNKFKDNFGFAKKNCWDNRIKYIKKLMRESELI